TLKNHYMKKIALLTVCMLFFAAVFNQVDAQSRKQVELKSTARTATGANTNIKKDKPTTDEPVKGKNSRGSGPWLCYVYLHNYTGYTVDIYLDGSYEGTLGAYADNYVSTGNGWTSVYGISAGKTKEWSGSGDCESTYDFNFY